ncbi:MAG: M48 family metallopeptidase [Eubacteriales bacterium]|nr:M48 family metallopeptidase [Eubacteriales bacterium]
MEYTIIRSKRKTLCIQITKDAKILVRAPLRASEASIRQFAESHTAWIETHLAKMQQQISEQQNNPYGSISSEELHRCAELALQTIPPRVEQFARLMQVTYGRITIRNQKTRWGSCSSKGNLNFNCLLMLTPPDVQDYVIVHELAHRKQMNHSALFWAEVEKVLPDYRERRKWLKDNGGMLIRRME